MQTTHVVDKIDEFTSQWCKKEAKSSAVTDRGIILSGPPGTGKTTILSRIVEDSGFFNLAGEALNGSSFNCSYVGQSETLIRDLFARGHRLWWLPCALIIDELEVMVPRRSTDGSSKGTKVRLMRIVACGCQLAQRTLV